MFPLYRNHFHNSGHGKYPCRSTAVKRTLEKRGRYESCSEVATLGRNEPAAHTTSLSRIAGALPVGRPSPDRRKRRLKGQRCQWGTAPKPIETQEVSFAIFDAVQPVGCVQNDADKAILDKYTIVETQRTWQVFNWLQYFESSEIVAGLAENGFETIEISPDFAAPPSFMPPLRSAMLRTAR